MRPNFRLAQPGRESKRHYGGVPEHGTDDLMKVQRGLLEVRSRDIRLLDMGIERQQRAFCELLNPLIANACWGNRDRGFREQNAVRKHRHEKLRSATAAGACASAPSPPM